MAKNDENWLAKYSALREHVKAHGHLTDRHTHLNNWWKYQKKKRKEGKLTDEQCRLIYTPSGRMSTQAVVRKSILNRPSYCWICKYLHAILLSSIGKGKKIEIKFVGAITELGEKV